MMMTTAQFNLTPSLFHFAYYDTLKQSLNDKPHSITTDLPDASWHTHDEIECILYLGNLCHYKIDNQTFTLYKGDVLVIPAHTPHQAIYEEKINHARYVIRLSSELYQQFVLSNPTYTQGLNDLITKAKIYRLNTGDLDYILQEFQCIVPLVSKANDIYPFAIAYHLFQAMIRLVQSSQSNRLPGNYHEDHHFSHIIYYIDHHFRDPNLQLQRITEEFGLSPYYFSKLFRREMNLNFHDYLIQKRANYAANLIRSFPQHSLSLQEVASQSGFGDYSTFYRSFKKTFTQSPKDFMRSLAK